MSQSRKGSLAETVVNTSVGYILALGTNALVLPAFGFHVSIGENVGMTLIFTAISIARSYVLRRVFNRLHGRN